MPENQQSLQNIIQDLQQGNYSQASQDIRQLPEVQNLLKEYTIYGPTVLLTPSEYAASDLPVYRLLADLYAHLSTDYENGDGGLAVAQLVGAVTGFYYGTQIFAPVAKISPAAYVMLVNELTGTFLNAYGNAYTNVANGSFQSSMSEMWGSLKNLASATFNYADSEIQQGISNLENDANSAEQWAKNAWSNIANYAENEWSNLENGAENIWSNATNSPGGLVGLGAAFVNTAFGLGYGLGYGIASAIRNLFGARHDPIVLDLAGAGLKIEDQSNGFTPYFDFTGNGFATRTSWIGSGNGFLVIESANSAFGTSIGNGYKLLGTGSESGFSILTSLDADSDGAINASDGAYSQLYVWQDLNGDGIAKPDEISSLAQLGITNISLATTQTSETIGSSTVTQLSSVTFANGTTHEIAEVNLGYSPTQTQYVGNYALDPAVENLPNIKGYGDVADLAIQMSIDPSLLAMVESLSSSPPTMMTALDAEVQGIMYQWAGVEDVSLTSGNIFDGQKVDFMADFLQYATPFSTNPSAGPAPWFIGQAISMNGSWNSVFDMVEARLLVQGVNSVLTNNFSYSPYGGDVILPTDSSLADSIANIATGTPSAQIDAVNYWLQALIVINQSVSDIGRVDSALGISWDSSSNTAVELQAAAPSYFSADILNAVAKGTLTYIEMSALNNVVYGTAGTDLFDVSQSNMTIEGFGGGDEIIVNSGVANLNINEVENNPSNSNVLFMAPGIDESNVTVSADATGDIILTYDGQGDQVTLDSMLFGPTSGSEQGPLHTDLPYSPSTEYGVQDVVFSDGTTWTAQQVIDMLPGTGSPDNTTLLSGKGGRTLDPAGYAHLVVGRDGADTILYNQGYGNLTIDENNAAGNEHSILQFGSGISSSEILVSDSNDGYRAGNLFLTIGTTGTRIILDGMADDAQDGVSEAVFSDGTTISAAQLRADAGIGSPVNTVLYANVDTSLLDPNGYAHSVMDAETGQTIVYNEGYGDLYIQPEFNASPVLAFGSSVSEANIIVSQDGLGDVILTDLSTGATIDLEGMAAGSGIGEVTFADGTTWSSTQILQLADTGNIYNQTLYQEFDYSIFNPNGYAHDVKGGTDGQTILYSIGDGNLTINDAGSYDYWVYRSNSPQGNLLFGAGISAADVSVSGDAKGDVILSIGTTGSEITIDNQLEQETLSNLLVNFGIGHITFADGTSWSNQQIAEMAETGSSTNTTLYGSTEAQTIDPTGYAHVIDGMGSATTVKYNNGYGSLTINESIGSPLTTIQMGAGISEADLAVVSIGYQDIEIDVGGTEDSITINNVAQLGAVEFSDGTVWAASTLLALSEIGSVPNETLTGQSSANLFLPNGYAHEVDGGPGTAIDTIEYNLGDGNIVINEQRNSSNQNTLVFGAGITEGDVTAAQDSQGDILLYVGGSSDVITLTGMAQSPANNSGGGPQDGVASVEFADGTTWTAQQIEVMLETGNLYNHILSAAVSDVDTTFNADAYARVINGSGAADTINYSAGSGDLYINEQASSGTEASVLNLGSGITEGDVLVGQSDGNIILQIGSFSDQITLAGMASDVFNSTVPGSGVGSVVFTDGTTWSSSYILSLLDNGSAINTTLTGLGGTNTFDPLGSAHTIDATNSAIRSSTILYNQGYGELTIDLDSVNNSEPTTLVFGPGISASDVSVSTDSDGDIIFTYENADNQITVQGMRNSPTGALADVVFSDGTSWNTQQILAMADIGSASNTVLFANYESNTFDPAGFAHLIEDNGNSTIYYNEGYGNLEIDPVTAPVVGTTTIFEFGVGFYGSKQVPVYGDESTLDIGPGISASDISFAYSGNDTIVMTDEESGSQVQFDHVNSFATINNGDVTPSILFSDGYSLSSQQIIEAAQRQGSGQEFILYGDAGGGTLDPGGFYRIIQGGGGADAILYNLGYGNLSIIEESSDGPEGSFIQFGTGISASDVEFSEDEVGDVILTVGTDQNEITLNSMLLGPQFGVEALIFVDSTTISAQQIDSDAQTGSSGNTTLYAFGGVNSLVPNGFAHTVIDNSGGVDTITYGVGDGNLIIDESNSSGSEQSVLWFSAGISESDVAVTGNGDDIILTIGGSGSQIVLSGMEKASNDGVGAITFSDGTTWTSQRILGMLDIGSSTNGALTANGGTNTFDSQGYAQSISDYAGGTDTIIYGENYGGLTVNEYNPSGAEQSVLQFGAGIAEGDVSVSEDASGDILLTVEPTGAQITLTNMADSSSWGVAELTFTDGTTWTAQQLLNVLDTGTPTVTTLTANYGENVFNPNGYANLIIGSGGSDVILYSPGDGNLTIDEPSTGSSSQATLAFGAGISESGVSVANDGNGDLLLAIGSLNSTITLTGMLDAGADLYNGIGKVTFADGTTWSAAQLVEMLDTGSAANTTLVASGGNNNFDPAAYASTITDNDGGDDTIAYNLGYANIQVFESNPNGAEQSVLQFGAGISEGDVSVSGDANGDIVLTVGPAGGQILLSGMATSPNNGVGSVTFADDTTWTAQQVLAFADIGSPSNTTLYSSYENAAFDPSGFAHVVNGGNGVNTILYNAGYGDLTVNEQATGGEKSILQFGAGISASDITVSGDAAGDIILSVAGLGTTITLTGMLSNPDAGVGSLSFADGSTLSAQQLIVLADTGALTNQTLQSNGWGVEVDPNRFAHVISGNGSANQILYSLGYGSVIIDEASTSGPVQDVLQFGTGISESDIAVSSANGADIVLSIGSTGDQVILSGMLTTGLNGTYTGVARVGFADGTVLSASQLIALLGSGSAENTTLTSGPGGGTLDPAGFAHVVDGDGDGGADTILYNSGYGNLTINEINPNGPEQSVLQFGAGLSASDILIGGDAAGDVVLMDTLDGAAITLTGMLDNGVNGTSTGVGSVTFVDGTTWTGQQIIAAADTGTPVNTTLYGGTGAATFQTEGYAQVIDGSGGADTILYTATSGNLQINEQSPDSAAQGVLQFGTGISAADLTITTDGYGDILLGLGSLGGQIDLTSMLNGTQYGIGSIEFADGTNLSASQIDAFVGTVAPPSTTLYATLSSETLDAAGSFTAVQGNGGADTILYNQGYGNLTIVEQNPTAAEQSILQFGTGISEADVSVAQDQNGDIVLTVGPSDAQITIAGMVQSDQNGVAAVDFADGTTWTAQQIIAMTETGSVTNSTLTAGPGNNVFDPAGFAHVVNGDGGADTILYNLGDGLVRINEENQTGLEQSVLQFGTGISQSDLSVSQDAFGDVILTIGTAGGQVILSSMIDSGEDGISFGVGSATFADGTTLSAQQLITMAETGSATNTILRSGPDGDTIDPNGFANLIEGGGGADTIIYSQGYGALTIDEMSLTGTEQSILQFGAGISAVELTGTIDAAGDVILTIGSFNDQVTLTGMANGLSYGVGEAVFADGTTLSAAQIDALAAFSPSALSGTSAAVTATDEIATTPFASLLITDANAGTVTESVTITPSNPVNGVLFDPNAATDGSVMNGGAFTISGSAAEVTSVLEALIFTPTAHQVAPGQTVTTNFTITDQNSDGLTTTDMSTNVIVTAANDLPVIGGTIPGQVTSDEASLSPLSGVTIADPDTGVTETVTITLMGVNGVATDADGVLAGNGLSKIGTGLYALAAATPAGLTTELEALTFTPAAHQVAPGGTIVTDIDLAVTQNGLTATDTVTSIIATAVNDVPVIAGTSAGQTTTDEASLNPFSGTTVTDPDVGVEDMVTITLTGTGGTATDANGTLTGAGLIKVGTGVYTLAAASPSSLTSELEALTFTPTAHQVTLGGTVVTDFVLAITQSGLTSTNTTTSVISTNDEAGTIIANGTLYALESGQTLNTGGTIHAISGGSFANTIIYDTGYGALTISEANPGGTEQSSLVLGSGITESQLVVSSDAAGDIILTVGSSSSQITLTGMMQSLTSGVGSISFTDGTTWTSAEVVELAALRKASSSGSIPTAYNLAYGIGQKTISAPGTFVIPQGIAKNDVIFQSNNSNGNLTIALLGANGQPTGDSYTISGYWWNYKGLATVVYNDGSTVVVGNQVTNTWIGTATQKTLVGSDFSPNVFELAAGGDQVTLGATYDGGNGQNTLDFGYGDGAVTVTPNEASATIALAASILPNDVIFQSNNNNGNLTVELLNANGQLTGDSLTIDGYWWNSSGTNLAVFANGTTFGLNHQLTETWIGSATQTTLIGSDFSPNVFDLGSGGDQVTLGANYDGGNGQNIVNFGTGDGAVTITGNNGLAAISLANGISLAGVTLSTDTSGDIILTLSDGTDKLVVSGGMYSSAFQQLDFANGTVLTQSEILYTAETGTTGNNTITLPAGPEVIDGRGGNDVINGGGGYDTYIYRQGYGNLTVNNAAAGGTVANGELDFGPGITEQDLWFSRSGNNLDINVLGSKSQIAIDNWYGTNAGAQVKEIKAYDGVELDTGLNQLVAAMAVFSSDNAGFNPETATQMPANANLQAAIAAAWHSHG